MLSHSSITMRVIGLTGKDSMVTGGVEPITPTVVLELNAKPIRWVQPHPLEVGFAFTLWRNNDDTMTPGKEATTLRKKEEERRGDRDAEAATGFNCGCAKDLAHSGYNDEILSDPRLTGLNFSAFLLKMDATALQHENQKLVQQLEAQKSEMHVLEAKFKELRNEQSSYDNTLISLDKTWNQLVDDLILLGVRFGGGLNNLPALDHEELSEESIESCPSEEIFLFMLLKSNNYGKKDDSSFLEFAEEALALRRSATLALMRSLQEAIAAQQARSEHLSLALNGEKCCVALQNHNDHLKEVVGNVREAISIVNEKHKRYLDEIEAFKSSYSKELQEIKHLSGELEETMAELEESRLEADKSSDKNMGWGDLKDAVEEVKTISANRLFELHETQEDNLILSGQLEDLQGQLKDDNYIFTSKPYTILSDQLHHLNAEIERYKGLVEVLQISEQKEISDRYNEQVSEIKSLKELIETLEKENQELEFIVDMYGKECSESRDQGIRKSSSQQAEYLRTSLEEHSLELRVKAANEAESACQRRLCIAEAELEDLRTDVDASERDVLELKEAIRIKEAEGDAYISEIETIGQAYEDMQTQHQHLLQQVADRDDFNIKLVSDSVKTKQASASLLSEKHLLQKQLHQVNSSLESSKQKLARGEEQMKAYVTQAIKTSSENRHHAITIEKTLLEVSDAEKELKWLRSAVGASEKEYEQNQKKIAELKMDLERERSEKRKLEEEYEEVKNEVMELTSENEEATIQKLQDEIKDCKAILKCGVCFDRPKEVVITKCFHLFCSTCIQRNLELRHRKCPGCGTPFGQNDVREVKI
ncbi:E3 ubiquitin-protein ligase BRE1-like 2 [Hordeum vulgare]|nr:E3 ubiquitin-protein ligase BRE1-like 2 [Hordeum vulgare]